MDETVKIKEQAEKAAFALWQFIAKRHLQDDGSVRGCDSGLRWNLRIWRFVKSYLSFIPWSDVSYYYVQTQGYWILLNSNLYEATDNADYKDAALKCADVLVDRQTEEGCWIYDDQTLTHRVATVESCFAGLGMITAYHLSKDQKYLDSAIKVYRYMIDITGFQEYDSESIAINYFGNYPTGLVPNNSTLALWFISEFSQVYDIKEERSYIDGMVNFLSKCQLGSGELPYMIGNYSKPTKEHYLCYQYNAFQFLDLARCYEITGDDKVYNVIRKLAVYLSSGQTTDSDSKYNCYKNRPRVPYYTAVLSAALYKAHNMGLGDYMEQATRGYKQLLSQQKADGSFDYSGYNYGILSDKRSYPRMQVMILQHMLMLAYSG